jgi:DNA polymerase-1
LKAHPNRIHAWDTETLGINAREQSPVGNGVVLCAQAFIGPDVDFGNGPRLFIDNYADAHDILLEFKEYLEDPKYLKCWHNYSFDRHILYNHGIDVQGFGGDTMHMARLADPSRLRYSLKALTQNLESEITSVKKALTGYMIDQTQDEKALEWLHFYKENFLRIKKIDIESTFGFYKKLANGETGKILMMPDLEVIHCSS